MLRSRCLWSTSLLVVACCGDDGGTVDCGPGDAPGAGVTVSDGTDELVYGGFLAGANNDCPATGAPGGVVSLTVFGGQVEPAGTAFVSICVPRPDEIVDGAEAEVIADRQGDPRVQLIDIQADFGDGCRWALDAEAPVTGTVVFEGLCDGGTDPEGFAVTLDVAATVTETCPTSGETRQVTMTGRVAVAAQ